MLLGFPVIQFSWTAGTPVYGIVQSSADGVSGWATVQLAAGTTTTFAPVSHGVYYRVYGTDASFNQTTYYSNVLLVG